MASVIDKYRHVKPVTDDTKIMAILKEIAEMPQEQAKDYFVQSRMGGGVYLYGSPLHQGYVVEYVQGHTGSDSVSTLYVSEPIFHDRMAYMKAREELIQEFARYFDALPSTVAVFDQGRERQVRLSELGFAQLIDMLSEFKVRNIGAV